MTQERKYAILLAATILCARKLATLETTVRPRRRSAPSTTPTRSSSWTGSIRSGQRTSPDTTVGGFPVTQDFAA